MRLTLTSGIILFFTLFASAQEWVRQNPFAKLSQMYDIDFDGKHGIAVGSDATIFTTADGGNTWVPRVATQYATDLHAAHVVPGTMGQLMLAGGGQVLLLSENGGETWKTTHDEVPNVYKIQSLEDGTIIALGSDFGLYSIDEGLLWEPFNMPGFGVIAGHFTSIMNGWVQFGEFGHHQVFVTTNGGFTWGLRNPQEFPLITSIEMLNDTVGFLASRDYVYKTYDGGYNWLPLQTIAANHIQDLHVVDENNLWAALDNGAVYFSQVGGTVWEEINPNLINSNRTYGVWADGQGKMWLVGKYVSILYSPDFGETWVDQIPNSKQTLFEPNFYNAFIGMVGGSDGAILRTKNSGAVWEEILHPLNEHFFGMVMIDDSIAIAGSASGKIFVTNDQGNTWNVIGENLGQITDLFAHSRQIIFITNENGEIYKTTDGGLTWNKKFDTTGQLFGLDFFNEDFGWAIGSEGKIVITKDAGEVWTVQYENGRHQFSDVHFTTATEGWVVSSTYTDTIWHTINGGTTWEFSDLPDSTFLHGVSFMDRDTGWVVGGSDGHGVIYRTDNAGLSWYLDHVSPDAFRGIYAIPNSETAWAVGFGGNIMKYSSCTSPPALTQLRGNLEPCAGDTINYIVDSDEVDIFDWTFPSDWILLGNSNTSSIHFIAGSMAGQVMVQGSNACGDTTVQLLVDVFPVTPPVVTITEVEGVLISDITEGFHQWLFNGNIIPGANESNYQPTEEGTYQLMLTTFTSGCVTVSNEIFFVITSAKEPGNEGFIIYPNPVQDILHIQDIDGSPLQPGSRISIINMEGKMILSSPVSDNRIRIEDIPSGLYYLNIMSGDKNVFKKIIVE